MEPELVRELVEWIREITPAVWITVQRQVYLDAWFWLAATVVFVVAGLLCLVCALGTRDDSMVAAAIPLAILSFIVVLFAAWSAVSRFVNPDWQTIMLLCGLAK